MEPIDLLKEKLDRFMSARRHSFESYRKGDIDLDLHLIHLKNTAKWIRKYKQAIKILEENGK